MGWSGKRQHTCLDPNCQSIRSNTVAHEAKPGRFNTLVSSTSNVCGCSVCCPSHAPSPKMRAVAHLEVERGVRRMQQAHEEKVKAFLLKAQEINEDCRIRDNKIKELQQHVSWLVVSWSMCVGIRRNTFRVCVKRVSCDWHRPS